VRVKVDRMAHRFSGGGLEFPGAGAPFVAYGVAPCEGWWTDNYWTPFNSVPPALESDRPICYPGSQRQWSLNECSAGFQPAIVGAAVRTNLVSVWHRLPAGDKTGE